MKEYNLNKPFNLLQEILPSEHLISLISTDCYTYPKEESFFRPSIIYPEYFFSKKDISLQENKVYDAVRESLHLLELDKEHFGTPKWNPLGVFVRPGSKVVIKPNLVSDKNLSGKGTDCLYTHPSVVAAVIDYVLIALHGEGKIIIGDAPVQECDFNKLIQESGYARLVEWYIQKGFSVDLKDFRQLHSTVKRGIHNYSFNSNVTGKIINLGKESAFYGASEEELRRLRITNYDPSILKTHHTLRKHEYYIAEDILEADTIINMPKPKTHRLAGVTISLKNMVGINVRKEFLPHHTMGSVQKGGDEYRKSSALHELWSKIVDEKNIQMTKGHFKRAFFCREAFRLCSLFMKRRKEDIRDGAWYGNHTISRTIMDLNKIIQYADKNGKMTSSLQRRMFIVADMIVCGEKEGPLRPSPKKVGMIAAGTNPIRFDEAICTMMGFDPEKIPTIQMAKQSQDIWQIKIEREKTVLRSNSKEYNNLSFNDIENMRKHWFFPSNGWVDHIEL